MKNKIFEEYFLRYKNLVMKIVVDGTGNYDVALEICQQVFVKFYQNMDRISDEKVKAWLITATRNAIIDYYRKRTKERELFSNPETEVGNVVTSSNMVAVEERLDYLNLLGKVLRTVKSVNPQWFEVLFLNCVEEMPFADIAKKLNISETVLRARLYRARLFVKEKFGDEYYET